MILFSEADLVGDVNIRIALYLGTKYVSDIVVYTGTNSCRMMREADSPVKVLRCLLFEAKHEQIVVRRKSAPLGIRLDLQFDRPLDQFALVQDDTGRNLVFVLTDTHVLDGNAVDKDILGIRIGQTKIGTSGGACVDRHFHGLVRHEIDRF